MEAVDLLALHRAVEISAQVEAQISVADGCQPLVVVLMKARAEAAIAIGELIEASPDDHGVIRDLQTTIHRYRDLCRWLSEIVSAGFDADDRITEEQREELAEALAGNRIAEAQLADTVVDEGQVRPIDE